MDTNTILLLIFAGYMLVNGLFILVDSKSGGEMLDEIIKSKSIGRIWATLTLTLGIVVLGQGYQIVWEGYDWVLPLLGWVSLIKGIVFYWWPSLWNGFRNTATSNIILTGLFAAVMGVLLLFLVF